MSKTPPAVQLIQFFDNNPTRYKNEPEADGYNSTKKLTAELTRVPLISNPTPQTNVAKPADQIASTLKVMFASAKLASFSDEALAQLNSAILKHDFELVRWWAKIGEARSKVSSAELVAIEAEIDAEVPDPNWPAQIDGVCDLDNEWPGGEKGITQSYINLILGR